MPAQRFREKPVVIKAFQMTEARRRDNSEWPDWLHEAWQQDPSEGALWCDPPGGEALVLGTLEGVAVVTWGDWIIQGVQGELDLVKPDIFEATYEPVTE